MRYIIALIIALPLLMAASLEAEAGLVEDLRSGKSDVRAATTQGSYGGIVSYWRKMISQPNFKAIVSARSNGYAVVGRHSAEAAVEGAIKKCQESGGGVTRCEVYTVGDTIVQGHSQTELADAIEAYQLKLPLGRRPASAFKMGYCKTKDNYAYKWNSDSCAASHV